MPKFEDYKDKLKEIYPNASNKELKDLLDANVKFWESMIKNIN